MHQKQHVICFSSITIRSSGVQNSELVAFDLEWMLRQTSTWIVCNNLYGMFLHSVKTSYENNSRNFLIYSPAVRENPNVGCCINEEFRPVEKLQLTATFSVQFFYTDTIYYLIVLHPIC